MTNETIGHPEDKRANRNNTKPWNFATWTSINLAHCVDFLRSIMEQHGDLRGDYEPLSEITKALETNIRYAEETKEQFSLDDTNNVVLDGHGNNIARNMWQKNTTPSDLELRIRKEVMDAVDVLVIEIFKESSSKRMEELSEFIQDRLDLLWREKDE